MTTVDAVILAAGEGNRLAGVAARYHKPLLVVNGKPLIRNALELVSPLVTGRTFIVVAPSNAAPISDVIEDLPATLLVQRHTSRTGPGDALLQAATLSQAEQLIVLMADNVFSPRDIEAVLEATNDDAERGAAGIQRLPAHEAERFTRFDPMLNRWVEKQPLPPTNTDMHVCWLGPLVLNRHACLTVLQPIPPSASELLIGPYLTAMGVTQAVEVGTYDIGTLDMWPSS